MQRALLLDVVVGEVAVVLELLAGKDQALLVGGDACSQYTQRSSASMGARIKAVAAAAWKGSGLAGDCQEGTKNPSNYCGWGVTSGRKREAHLPWLGS